MMREIHVWSMQRRETGAVESVFGEGLGLCPPLEAQQSFFVTLSPLLYVHCTAFVMFFSSVDQSECDETREMQSGKVRGHFHRWTRLYRIEMRLRTFDVPQRLE
jgi:hypothetical protein